MLAAGADAAAIEGDSAAADGAALAEGVAVDAETSVERGGDGCVGAAVGGM